MSKSNSLENSMLLLFFNGTTFADLAENDTTAPATSLYVSLHTADPGEAGSQTTSEIAYTGYARAAVARTSGGWTVTANAVENTAIVNWPACTAGSGTATHFGIGTLTSGAGVLLYSGALTASLAISAGITPSAAAGALDVTED
jgi:hypothetical protein